MYKTVTVIACLILITFPASSGGQLLSGPESVAFDSLNNRYLVSNYHNGVIIQIDENSVQDTFKAGLGHCYGNHINGNILYVATGSRILGIDLNTADIIKDISIYPLIVNLDGNTFDTSGFLYVLDTGGKIIKVNLETEEFSFFINSGLPAWPQDIIYDKENNRLLVCAYAFRSPIMAVNIEDSSVSVACSTYTGYFDGITIDQYGNVYAASHYGGGRIYKWERTLTEPPEVISSGHNEPAGLDYNTRDNVLAIPNFGGNTVDFIPVSVTSINEGSYGELPEGYYLYQNYPNPFNASTIIKFDIPTASEVSLDIYDVIGRKIGNSQSFRRSADQCQITYNARSLPSGIYFYRVRVDGYSETKMMSVIK